MFIFYLLLAAYILYINFYSFLLVKTLRDQEKQEARSQTAALPVSAAAEEKPKSIEKPTGRLYLTGLLGGAVTIYVCMFLYKYKRNDLLLMVLMPVLGVLNIYLFALLFKSGFGFLVMR